ncbi:hypothetical protein IKE79_00100 [Candidatus Saccharibacteria bacterium]|nr:hypothetical protein [Candidatus Saccharibacteria bacterium]
MKILTEKIKRSDLRDSDFIMEDEMVKAVVDVERGLLAIDAELHADLEKMFLDNGANQLDLWGINLYFDGDLIEYDSMINIRPAQGNRSRDVEDEAIRTKIQDIVAKWVEE